MVFFIHSSLACWNEKVCQEIYFFKTLDTSCNANTHQSVEIYKPLGGDVPSFQLTRTDSVASL